MSGDLPAGLLEDLAWLSDLVYQPWDLVGATLGADPVTFDAGDTQAMLVARAQQDAGIDSDGRAVARPAGPQQETGLAVDGRAVARPSGRDGYAALVFRGTEFSGGSWTDLWANFGIPARWPGAGHAHAGYARALDLVFAPALAMLDRAEGPVWVAGHSLGGALATLFACRIGPSTRYRLAGCVSFGAPRPARATAYATLRCRMVRVVNEADFAPGHGWPLFAHPPGDVVRLDSGGPVDGYYRHDVREYRRALARLGAPGTT